MAIDKKFRQDDYKIRGILDSRDKRIYNIKNEALARQDGARYAAACDSLGLADIEDMELYNRGTIEKEYPTIQKELEKKDRRDSKIIKKIKSSQQKLTPTNQIRSYPKKIEELPTYNISKKKAKEILTDFDWNEKPLRSLVSNITRDPKYADSLDYRGLKREGHKIKGLAKKILKDE